MTTSYLRERMELTVVTMADFVDKQGEGVRKTTYTSTYKYRNKENTCVSDFVKEPFLEFEVGEPGNRSLIAVPLKDVVSVKMRFYLEE